MLNSSEWYLLFLMIIVSCVLIYFADSFRGAKNKLGLIHKILINLSITGIYGIYLYENSGHSINDNIIIGVVVLILLYVAIVDGLNGVIPDKLNYSMIGLSVLLVTINYFSSYSDVIVSDLKSMLLSSGMYLMVILILSYVVKQDWIGGGDIKIFAWLVVLLGGNIVINIIYSALILAVIVYVFNFIVKKKRSNQIRFGPYILMGYVVVMWGLNIFDAIVRLN